MGAINFGLYLPAGTKRGREPSKGGFNYFQPSPTYAPVACAPSKCTPLMSLYCTNTRYVQCSTEREYRLARQAIWVVQVVLVASNECGWVTVWELLLIATLIAGNEDDLDDSDCLIFFSLRECSHAGLIQGQEEIKKIRYLFTIKVCPCRVITHIWWNPVFLIWLCGCTDTHTVAT